MSKCKLNLRGVTVLCALLISAFSAGTASAADTYNALITFGHSWTGPSRNPPDPNYWNGFLSNGPLWVHYLSTNLGLAYVPSNNFAVAGATSADVLNLQIPSYRPGTNAAEALFVIWSYENDFNKVIFIDGGSGLGPNLTNNAFWNNIILRDISNTSNSIVALYNKGARSIVIPNMVGYDDVLGNGSPSNGYYNIPDATRNVLGTRSVALNQQLVNALNRIEQSHPDLRLFRLDFHSLLHAAILNYQTLGFTKANISALDDAALADKSFTGPGKDYLWWDQLHPTTRFHQVWAGWILNVLNRAILERLDLVTEASGQSQLRLAGLRPGQSYTIQSSLDLRQWLDLSAFQASAGTNIVPLSSLTNGGMFYRLRFQN